MSTPTIDHDDAVIEPPADDRIDALQQQFAAYRMSRDTWTLLVLALTFLIGIASVIGVGLALRAANDNQGAGAAAEIGGGTITAQLSEFGIALSAGEIGPGGSITATNNGSIVHNLGVRDTDLLTPDINAGESATLDLTGLDPGVYEVYCEIAGHADSGMVAPLVITDDVNAATQAAQAEDRATPAMDHESITAEEGAAMDEVMMDSMQAFPAETEGRGNEALVPEILPDGTKHFELTASIVDWEVAPGEVVQAWAYNGIVPGPRIDLDVGDTVEFEFTNELPLGSDIHWHGIEVPNEMDGVAPFTQDLVLSGETFAYRFTTTEAAIGMYHAHAHGDQAIPNGLFGTIYVGDVPLPTGRTISGIELPDDITIAHDIPMVVNDAGVIGMSLNGKSFPATEPLVVDLGDWVEATYFNEGLQSHPMHLHGFDQFVIAKDGKPLDQPYAADTILVAPGERYTVMFHADQVGTWVWHCHIINHVESSAGMFGMVTAVIVQDPSDA
ncbi:hypothetical protein BH24ACT5_BH24ACT5_21630 [soil metagenome]